MAIAFLSFSHAESDVVVGIALYKPCSENENTAVISGGVGITALVCDDAGRAGQSEAERKEGARQELTK